MTIEQEEKLLKNLGAFSWIIFLVITFFIKNDIIKLSITVPVITALTILNYRKYQRDKKEGKDLSKYKTWLIFIGVTFFICIIFLLLPYF